MGNKNKKDKKIAFLSAEVPLGAGRCKLFLDYLLPFRSGSTCLLLFIVLGRDF